VELLINDLSLHGQFPDSRIFRTSMGRIMEMRRLASQYGTKLHCHKSLTNARVTLQHSFQQAIQFFGRDEQRAVMQWLTQDGPFWNENREHGVDDYLEHNQNIVTDSAMGEAAFCCRHGLERRLISFSPSSWEASPIFINWIHENELTDQIEVINYWELNILEEALRTAPVPIQSWDKLAEVCETRFPNLTFGYKCFEQLRGQPFAFGASERIRTLLDTLNRFKQCFDAQGQRTAEGNRIYQEHFIGDKAWFSNSSESEMRDFGQELTFRHPTDSAQSLFCPWHGKVKTPQIRIHFSWPIQVDKPLYIVYVGPKLTKR